MNNVNLIGRLTNAVDFRYSQAQNPYCFFTIAVDRGLSKEKKEELQAMNKQTADFIRIVVYGVMAENCKKYLKKGRNVAVQGRIQTGVYTAEDGQKKYTFNIEAERVQFIDWGDKEKETDSFDNWDVGISEARDEEIPF
ncbi:single-stranded DNA-binding protein [Parvimonas sp. G1967]|uniref:single-stranded DNA-binding protein n=1 Tax=Parvimonas sp. G1967 TaxID=3387695 RepID=UPI0039E4948F